MTPQLIAAMVRALIGAVLTAGGTFFATYQAVEPPDAIAKAGMAAGAAFFTYMITRGGLEGLIDSNREPNSADVGQPPS